MVRLRQLLSEPVDAAGLVVFRVAFGLLATFAAVRFVALGWVEELLLAPGFHFAWVRGAVVPPGPVLYALFAAQAVAGLGIAAGRAPRAWLVLWLLSFGYVELLDKTLYLNHYVLFTLLGVWLLVIPMNRAGLRRGSIPRWALWLLRAQVASVYVWAGLAKLNPDWLLRAEPLRTWLDARADLPVLGTLLSLDATAYAMSWGGALYDLAIPWLLLHPRTRGLGVGLVVFFHVAVGWLFPIGVFPALMMVSATLFLDPSWPRRWLGGAALVPSAPVISRAATGLWLAAVVAMFLVPGRFLLQGTDVSWSERGYRFAWRVLLNEKTGLVDFRVVEPASGRTWRAMPSDELTELQHKQMRTQPDMIRDYALHLRDVHREQGREVAVYADAWASLNGRPSQRLLRDDLDLTIPLRELDAEGWILPLESR